MRFAICVVLAAILASCSLGKESILFTTKTSFAVDIDSKPPTFDVGYARKEGALAPVVASGEVLPLMTSFGADAGLLDAVFGVGIGAQFALGKAASITSKYISSDAHLNTESTELIADVADPLEGTIQGDLQSARRYVFGTDTVLGFRVNMSPETANVPDSVTLGWRRKEFAYVPITEIQVPAEVDGSYVRKDGTPMSKADYLALDETARAAADQELVMETRLRIPSLIATAGADASAGRDNRTRVSSFYATGIAATYLSAVPFIRQYVTKHVVSDDELSAKIEAEALQHRISQLEEAGANGDLLKIQADALIDGLTADKLETARTEMIGTKLIDPTDAFDADLDDAGKKSWLKAKTQIFNDPELVPALEEYVRRLANLTSN